MTVQIEELLRLPDEVKREIADILLHSLSEHDEELTEDEIKIVEKRWADIESGKSILLTEEEFKQKLKERRLVKENETA